MLARGLAVAITVLALDQLSKAAVRGYFAARVAGEHENITSFFNVVLIYNRGMSFGLFNQDSPWIHLGIQRCSPCLPSSS